MCIGVPGQVLAVGDDIHLALRRWWKCVASNVMSILPDFCEGKPADLIAMGIGTRWFCDEHH